MSNFYWYFEVLLESISGWYKLSRTVISFKLIVSHVAGRLVGRKLLLGFWMAPIILLEEGLKMGAGQRLQIRCWNSI